MIRFLALGLTWAMGAAPVVGQPHAHSGRIDIYVAGSAFELSAPRGSYRTQVGHCSWLGEGKERTGVTCEKRLGREWEEIWVEFTAEGSGEVDIDLQGEYYQKQGDDDVRLVWADNVSVEGAGIDNQGFEEAGAEGGPAGWRFTGPFPLDRYSRDGSVAQEGRACVGVWWGGQARQAFRVERGRTYRVAAWFRAVDPSQIAEPLYVPWGFEPEVYTQELEATFTSEEAARVARLEMLPLYEGYDWAISSRWDDNNTQGDLELHAFLLEHGHKGTFYLNQTDPRLSAETARKLLEGGCSIGGHSLSHPMLTYCSRNRIFEEVAAVRADREATTDAPIVSYAFSFCNFRNGMEGDAVQTDITRALERAGYYHIVNHQFHAAMRTDMIISPIMPSDGRDIEGFAESALRDEWFREDHPNLSYSMHAWYRTPEAWAKFGRHLDQYGGRADWWYCNQNAYAAYRQQYRQTKLAEPVREGRRVRFALRRPVLLDLNDAIPLTFEIRGVPVEAVEGVVCATAECSAAERKGAGYRFNLSHDRDQSLPRRIGVVHNPERREEPTEADVDPDFPGVRVLLYQSGERLRVTLANRGEEPLERVRVTYRTPTAWVEGVVRRQLGDIQAGGAARDELRLTPATEDYKQQAGSPYFQVQIDFVRGGERGRLHADCHAPPAARDASFPQGGFLRLGPVPESQFGAEGVAAAIRSGELPQGVALQDGALLEWQLDDDPMAPPYLDPEVVRTTGRWRTDSEEPFYYLLATTLHSAREQAVSLQCVRGSITHAAVNDADAFTGTAKLREGENRLVLIYRGENRAFGPEHAGCFVRLARPGTTERLTDVRYEPRLP